MDSTKTFGIGFIHQHIKNINIRWRGVSDIQTYQKLQITYIKTEI